MADKHAQGFRQVGGQGGGDEFGEDFLVRKVGVDYVLKPVLQDEPVEKIGRQHQGAGNQHTDPFPFVIEIMALEDRVQEGEAAGLSAQRTLAQTGEADGIVVAGGFEAGDDAQPLLHPVMTDGTDGGFPALVGIVETASLDPVPDLEQTAGQQPAGDIVLGSQAVEVLVRDGGNDALRPVQVARTGDFLTGRRIRDDEVAEAEFPADEFRQVMGQGLGPLDQEARLEGRGDGPHALLGGLHQDGHLGVVLPDHPAQVDARIQFLLGRFVPPVQDEADIGDDTQHVGLVFLVQGDGIVVVGGHQDFRAGAFPETLLAFVQGVPDGLAVLQEDQAVQLGEIGGVITDRILHQKDTLDSVLQDVHRRVPAVLQQLDDGDDEVRGVVPAEDAVEMAAILVFHLPVDLLGEGRQEDDRSLGVDFLDPLREIEHIHFAYVVHRDGEVETFPFLHHPERFHGGFRPYEFRRVGKVQFRVFRGDPGFDAPVLFQGELVVIVADQQDPADPPGHQRGSRFSHLSSV